MGRKRTMVKPCATGSESKRWFRLRVLGRNDSWEWRYFRTFKGALRYAKSISYTDDELPVIYRKEGTKWHAWMLKGEIKVG